MKTNDALISCPVKLVLHLRHSSKCTIFTKQALATMLMIGFSMGSFAFTGVEKTLRENCAGCHGIDGKAKVESWPNLACQNRGYLYSRLLFLRREKDHDIDERVKGLSLSDIDDISRYYSELKCPRP